MSQKLDPHSVQHVVRDTLVYTNAKIQVCIYNEQDDMLHENTFSVREARLSKRKVLENRLRAAQYISASSCDLFQHYVDGYGDVGTSGMDTDDS